MFCLWPRCSYKSVTRQKCGVLYHRYLLKWLLPQPFYKFSSFWLCFRYIFLIYIFFLFLSFPSFFNLKQNPLILFSVYKMKASSDVFLQGIKFFGMEIHCMQLLNLTIRAYMRVLLFVCLFLSRHPFYSRQLPS